MNFIPDEFTIIIVDTQIFKNRAEQFFDMSV